MKLFRRRVSCPKVLLWLSNVTLIGCACALIALGALLYVDGHKQLISKLLGVTNYYLAELPRPLFFYVAIGLAGCGLICLFAAILGVWANCWTNSCTLTLYFLVVFILLIGEFVVSVSITIWPNCLGLNLDDNTLVATLTDQYGIPGHEQFTAAIDLAQTQFKCCGISSNIDYDTSYWRSKSYGQKDLTVPLTCCVLDNEDDNVDTAYLDPKPSNLSVCQSIIRDEYLKARHPKSCREDIQLWYQRHFILFMGIISAVALVHFFVLLTIIYSCTELKRKRSESIDHHIAEFERKVNDRRNIITEVSSSSTRSSPMLSNAGRDSFMQQHQQRPTSMQDYNNIKQRNLSTFQTASNRSSNRGTKAYLV